MKIIPGFNLRSFLFAVAFLAGTACATHASAQQQAFLVDLNSGTATSLGMLDGNYGTASGINDSGQVVGSVGNRAFITGPNGVGMRDLGTLGGDDQSQAYGINDVGQVVGVSMNGIQTHAFITGPNGVGMRDLGTLGGQEISYAYDINNTGQVAGRSFSAEGRQHAFITGPNGVGMRDLGTLSGVGGDYTSASGINDAGQVVGRSGDHAFITGPDGVGMRDLGTPSGDYSEAYAINDAGQVLGQTTAGGGYGHIFITGPDGAGMTDLNFLIASSKRALVGELGPMGINNSDQAIVNSYVIVVPEPESYALLLVGLALIGAVAWRKGPGLLPVPS